MVGILDTTYSGIMGPTAMTGSDDQWVNVAPHRL
jgi:hypothetical protein